MPFVRFAVGGLVFCAGCWLAYTREGQWWTSLSLFLLFIGLATLLIGRTRTLRFIEYGDYYGPSWDSAIPQPDATRED